jgi:hypothetical protein
MTPLQGQAIRRTVFVMDLLLLLGLQRLAHSGMLYFQARQPNV